MYPTSNYSGIMLENRGELLAAIRAVGALPGYQPIDHKVVTGLREQLHNGEQTCEVVGQFAIHVLTALGESGRRSRMRRASIPFVWQHALDNFPSKAEKMVGEYYAAPGFPEALRVQQLSERTIRVIGRQLDFRRRRKHHF